MSYPAPIVYLERVVNTIGKINFVPLLPVFKDLHAGKITKEIADKKVQDKTGYPKKSCRDVVNAGLRIVHFGRIGDALKVCSPDGHAVATSALPEEKAPIMLSLRPRCIEWFSRSEDGSNKSKDFIGKLGQRIIFTIQSSGNISPPLQVTGLGCVHPCETVEEGQKIAYNVLEDFVKHLFKEDLAILGKDYMELEPEWVRI